MSDPTLPELTVRDLVERLSTSAPIPGGGSAAAVAGSMGAALVEMVVALTIGRPAAAEHEASLNEISASARDLREKLLDLAQTDAAAYAAVVAARRMPRDTDAERDEREQRIATATRDATVAPLRTAQAADAVVGLAETVVPIANRNAVSDVGVAGLLAAAALRGAAMNVQINVPFLAGDDPLGAAATEEVTALLDGLDGREVALRAAVEARLG